MNRYLLKAIVLFLFQIGCVAQLQSQDIETREIETADTKNLQIDTENSYIHIYTGTAGLLKALSHKHQIAIRDVKGEIYLNSTDSMAHFSIQPGQFLVDDDAERAEAVNDEYKGPVASWIKTGTKKNMNGGKLLEADLYPTIQVSVRSESLERETNFSVEVILKNMPYDINVPGVLVISEEGVSASGDFELTHDDLGLKPFSIPGGVSRVADKLRFVFEIRSLSTQE